MARRISLTLTMRDANPPKLTTTGLADHETATLLRAIAVRLEARNG